MKIRSIMFSAFIIAITTMTTACQSTPSLDGKEPIIMSTTDELSLSERKKIVADIRREIPMDKRVVSRVVYLDGMRINASHLLIRNLMNIGEVIVIYCPTGDLSCS